MKGRKIFEEVDDRPVALPVGMKPPSETDRLKEIMGRLIVEIEGKKDVETFEESQDFDVDDDNDLDFGGVSQSEMRYMTEEKLLIDADNAARIELQRREAANFRRKYYGKDRDRRERVDGGRNDVDEKRDRGESEKRGAGGEERGQSSGSSGGVGKGGEKSG